MYAKTQDKAESVATRNKPNLVTFIAMTVIAAPMVGVGIIGLYAPEILPWRANPTVTWSLLAVGAMMDVAAVFILLSELRRVHAR